MHPRTCHQCGVEILDTDIEHRRRHFCSDECCDAFEDERLLRGGPDPLDPDAADAELDVDGLEPEDLDAEDLEDDDLDLVDEDLVDEDLVDDDQDDDLRLGRGY